MFFFIGAILNLSSGLTMLGNFIVVTAMKWFSAISLITAANMLIHVIWQVKQNLLDIPEETRPLV